jgi:Ca2+-binding RTX toxin-like protein
MRGNAGDDTIYGNDGNDLLDGGSGADYLSGGAGNDTYVVDSPDDQIAENNGEGSTPLKARSRTP